MPDYLDGKVITDLFTPEYLDAHPIARVAGPDEAALTAASGDTYSAEEAAGVRERLAELGYL